MNKLIFVLQDIGLLKKFNKFFLFCFLIFDFILISSSYVFSYYFTYNKIPIGYHEILFALSIIMILYICLERIEFFDIYRTYRFRPIYGVLKNVLFFEMTAVFLLFIINLTEIYIVSEKFIGIFFITTLSVFSIERLFVKVFLSLLRRAGYNFKRYLIIGAGELGYNFYIKLSESNLYGIKIIGFLNDRFIDQEEQKYADRLGNIVLGTIDEIETKIIELNIDSVIIALPLAIKDKIIEITNICEKCGVKAELVPDYYSIISENPSIRNISGYPLIGIRNVPLENIFNRIIKRITDVTLASIGLIFCLPIFLLAILSIKLSSPGPIFFFQKRTGFMQKDFSIIKFRTMVVNEDSDTLQATIDDPRKTKIGSFLRKWNIDELPQLFNIIKGNMSIVGPRPHMIAHTEEFYNKYDKYHIRHWVKPGLTGWAQVNGWRGDSDIAMRVKYDINYIENWTIWLDFKIIWLTVFGKKAKRNAH